MKQEKTHIPNPGVYRGVYSTGQMPSGVVHKELEREEVVRGKKVQYWHVWTKEPDNRVFKENEEPRPQKIGLLTRFLNEFKLGDDTDF